MNCHRCNGFLRALLWVLATSLATGAQATSTLTAFSAELDGLWNFDRPIESEQRFRAELERWPAGDAQALIVQTQIARAQGLRGQFDAARRTLDRVEPELAKAPSQVRVRYLLERGRVLNSSGAPQAAVPMFAAALDLAKCNGEEFYAVDAAHMLGIAAPPEARLDWNLQALALAEAARDPRAQGWRASLYNNIGWTWHERGNFGAALTYFEMALHEREARGTPADVRNARWAVARSYRSLGRNDDAQAVQLALARECEAAGETDGYVFEELAELAAARNDRDAARSWAAKARDVLGADPWFRANEGKRLARLVALAGSAP
jgi:tetratricopeptide (TPR) repeat protein